MRQAFLPFLIVACLAGLAVFEYPLGRPRILFSLAYIAFIWSIYGYFYFREPFRAIVRTWPKVAVLAYHINLFTLLIIFISNIYRIKEYHCCLDKLATVDDTLEKLGTRKDYSKVRKSTIKITSIWYIHALFINSMELLWTYNDTFLNVLFISGVINYPFHAVSIIILRFGILVSYTGSRFDRVNEHIRGLITDEDYGLTRSARALFVTSRPQSSMHVQKYKEMIRILM
ncbi:hypothetical protein KM043_008977 [Ampulex compressa]|nr:hypothetical protein KM043_008977 [Ampulex compressa]